MPKQKSLGQVAYEADGLCSKCSWEHLAPWKQICWQSAASAVAREVRRRDRQKTHIKWESAEVAKGWPNGSFVVRKFNGKIYQCFEWESYATDPNPIYRINKFALLSTPTKGTKK